MFSRITFWIRNFFYQRKLKKQLEEIRKKDPFIYD